MKGQQAMQIEKDIQSSAIQKQVSQGFNIKERLDEWLKENKIIQDCMSPKIYKTNIQILDLQKTGYSFREIMKTLMGLITYKTFSAKQEKPNFYEFMEEYCVNELMSEYLSYMQQIEVPEEEVVKKVDLQDQIDDILNNETLGSEQVRKDMVNKLLIEKAVVHKKKKYQGQKRFPLATEMLNETGKKITELQFAIKFSVVCTRQEQGMLYEQVIFQFPFSIWVNIPRDHPIDTRFNFKFEIDQDVRRYLVSKDIFDYQQAILADNNKMTLIQIRSLIEILYKGITNEYIDTKLNEIRQGQFCFLLTRNN